MEKKRYLFFIWFAALEVSEFIGWFWHCGFAVAHHGRRKQTDSHKVAEKERRRGQGSTLSFKDIHSESGKPPTGYHHLKFLPPTCKAELGTKSLPYGPYELLNIKK